MLSPTCRLPWQRWSAMESWKSLLPRLLFLMMLKLRPSKSSAHLHTLAAIWFTQMLFLEKPTQKLQQPTATLIPTAAASTKKTHLMLLVQRKCQIYCQPAKRCRYLRNFHTRTNHQRNFKHLAGSSGIVFGPSWHLAFEWSDKVYRHDSRQGLYISNQVLDRTTAKSMPRIPSPWIEEGAAGPICTFASLDSWLCLWQHDTIWTRRNVSIAQSDYAIYGNP